MGPLRFAWPADPPSWIAAALATALLLWSIARRRTRGLPALLPESPGLWAVVAAALSTGYVYYYLGGGPRIIDATSYWLQATGFSHGYVTWQPEGPVGSFHGRFLVNTSADAEPRLAVLFPPGYALALAGAMKLGAPLLLGPCLGATLVLLSYALGRQLFDSHPVGVIAAQLSALCAVLRYHTADTMAHGLSACLLLGAWLCALPKPLPPTATAPVAASEATPWWGLVLAGVCLGGLTATRPVSGFAASLALGGLLLHRYRINCWKPGLLCSVGMLPGVTLLVWHQHELTGHWLESSQLLYYALSDGPPGCFGYGLSTARGCQYEHGDFVARYLPEGYGLREALGTTARRLAMHGRDAINSEIGLLPAAYFAWKQRRHPAVRQIAALLAIWIFAYAPFYFDGNYPGGGARFFAEVLPLEQLLLAAAFARFPGWELGPLLALAGFAFQGHRDHRHLAVRDGGQPMLDRRVLARTELQGALLFVDTDHGFNLGFSPPHPGRVNKLARHRGDAHDYLLWKHWGKPSAWCHRFDVQAATTPASIEPYTPTPTYRFRGDALWPPLQVDGLWSHPGLLAEVRDDTRGLVVHPLSGSQGATLTVGAWVDTVVDPSLGARVCIELSTAWTTLPGARFAPSVTLTDSQHNVVQPELRKQTDAASGATEARAVWSAKTRLSRGGLRVRFDLHGVQGSAKLDWIEVSPDNSCLAKRFTDPSDLGPSFSSAP